MVTLPITKLRPLVPVTALMVATPWVSIIAFMAVVEVVPVVAATTPIKLEALIALTGVTPPTVVRESLTAAPRNAAFISTVANSFVELVNTLVS